jgi:uncharacterized protein with GYD domain
MAKYLIQASYTAEGLKGLHKDSASGRRDAVSKMVAQLGGKVDGFYFSFGVHDAHVILDLPDNVSAAALSMAVSATGLVRTITTPLMTVEEADAALKKKVSYKPPGG